MPAIYAASCESCGHASKWMADDWTGWREDDGRITVLPHPGEFDRLIKAGVDVAQAVRDGRVLHFANAVCDNCAAIKDVPYGDASMGAHGSWWSGIAFWSTLAAGGAVGVVAAIVAEMPWYVTILLVPVWMICGVLFGFFGVAYVADIPNRFRAFWKIKQEPKPLPPAKLRCEKCLTGGLYHLGYLAGRSLPCPMCSARSYVFGSVGIS